MADWAPGTLLTGASLTAVMLMVLTLGDSASLVSAPPVPCPTPPSLMTSVRVVVAAGVSLLFLYTTVPVLTPFSSLLIWAKVPENSTEAVPLLVIPTPESPAIAVIAPSATDSDTLTVVPVKSVPPAFTRSTSATLKPLPRRLKSVCSMAVRVTLAAVAVGASLTAVTLTLT